MARRTLDQTRQLLLDTGLRMLEERGLYVGVTHIRLQDVAAAAGLTTGAGYRCWENQAAFHRQLAIAAVGWRKEAPIAETVAHIRDLVDARAPLAEVIRVAAEANLFRYPDDTVRLNTITLRTCGPTDEDLARAGREHLTTTIESFATLYATLLEVYRRRMRPPYTITDLTLTLAALSEGFVVQAMTGDPHPRIPTATVTAGNGSAAATTDWSLLACAAEHGQAAGVDRLDLVEPVRRRRSRPATLNRGVAVGVPRVGDGDRHRGADEAEALHADDRTIGRRGRVPGGARELRERTSSKPASSACATLITSARLARRATGSAASASISASATTSTCALGHVREQRQREQPVGELVGPRQRARGELVVRRERVDRRVVDARLDPALARASGGPRRGRSARQDDDRQVMRRRGDRRGAGERQREAGDAVEPLAVVLGQARPSGVRRREARELDEARSRRAARRAGS